VDEPRRRVAKPAGVADREAEGGIGVLDLGAERVVRDPLDERPRGVEDRARAPYLASMPSASNP